MTGEEQASRGRELTTEEWLSVGRQAVDAGMVYLLLTGGEPMLRKDFTAIYSEMVRMGVVVSVNTNGTLITPEILECFQKHPPETVNVTLYGASPETYGGLCGVRGGYEKAFAGVRALIGAGVRVIINTTFTARNAKDMEALVAFAKEVGAPIRTAAYTFPPVRNQHEDSRISLTAEEQGVLNARFEYLTSTAEQRATKAAYLRKAMEAEAVRIREPLPARGDPLGCMAGRGQFWMAWNGEMYPCGMLSDYAAVKPAESGMDFADMWRQTHTRTEGIYLPAVCVECALRRVCPSCAAVTHSNHGDTAKLVEGMCTYTKTYVNTFLELMDTMGEGGEVAATEGGDVDPFVCL
jgi:radical SAM protein with 4Fe4S-binding SPASM domain